MSTTAVCPACDAEVDVLLSPDIGRRLNCPVCNAALKVIWMEPLELDFWDEDFEDEDYDEGYVNTDEDDDEDDDILFGITFLDQFGESVFDFDDGTGD